MTQLLVSVRNAAEARAALRGGAALIDVKEPANGPLGKADDAVIAEVIQAVAGRVPVSAALGELADFASANDANPPRLLPRSQAPLGNASREAPLRVSSPGERRLSDAKQSFATCVPKRSLGTRRIAESLAGLTYVKLGLAGLNSRQWQQSAGEMLPRLNERYPEATPVHAAYADWHLANSPTIESVSAFAMKQGKGIFLLDTYSKPAGKTLFDWIPIPHLRELCESCRLACVSVALAGSLDVRRIRELLSLKPDWIAVRGAACDGGRDGIVSEAKVRELVALIKGPPFES